SVSTFVLFHNPVSLLLGLRQTRGGSLVVEEELLQGLSFEAFRRTGTYLTVQGKGSKPGRTEMRPIDPEDFELALKRDQTLATLNNDSEAALSPQEE
ncbi:hypothetical protein, partial [uncultured Ruegeria sp.]|uniref:hypothetical protein n=1 Tax=uncultured Ruegeria sp. TaxID=259304 RepID=UPI00260638C1